VSLARIVNGRLLGAATVAGGFVAVFYWLKAPVTVGWPWLALAAAVVACRPWPKFVGVILWTAIAAVTAWRVIPPGLIHDDDWRLYVILGYPAIAGIILLLGLAVAPETRRQDVFGWALAAMFGATKIWDAGMLSYALLGVALAAVLTFVGAIDRRARAVVGAASVAAVLHPALLAAGAFNNQGVVATWWFAVIAVAPVITLVRPPTPKET
jgi:hypothetical protein